MLFKYFKNCSSYFYCS